MNRRHALTLLTGAFAAQAQQSNIKIEAVELWQYQGTREATRGINAQYQVQPLHIYDALRPPVYKDSTPKNGTEPITAIYLKLKCSKGLEGLYGPVDKEAAIVIDQQIRPFLIGKDALAGDTAWDQLWRLNRHARTGIFMMAISAVDNALWDLRGRAFNAPVYQLLGGPSRKEVEVYSSTLGSSLEPDKIAPRAKELFAQGFRNQKWFLPDGPGGGPEGFARNVKAVQILREALGPTANIMFDVFNGWDLPYAVQWCKEVEPLKPRWLEEPFSSEKIDAYTRLSSSTSIPIATGEHFYGRWEVHRFLKADAIRVVQADPEWCGGVSELKKICTLASLYDVPVIPHGHNLHAALHVVASENPSTCPLSEFLVLKMASYYHFDLHPLVPVSGKILMPTRPGFGMELNKSKIINEKFLSWSL